MVDKNNQPLVAGQNVTWIDRQRNQIRRATVDADSQKWADDGHDLLTINVTMKTGVDRRVISRFAVRVIGGKGSPLVRMADNEKTDARLIRRERMKAIRTAPDLTPFLTDDLRRAPWKGSDNVLAGHCYVAAEVHFHMWAKKFGFTPHFLRWEGAPHWYLQDATGLVLDPTADQFASKPDYKQGKGKGFLTKQASKRAQVVYTKFMAA